MSFKEWFNEDDHDLYNFPEEAMEQAWNAAVEAACEIIEGCEGYDFEIRKELITNMDKT